MINDQKVKVGDKELSIITLKNDNNYEVKLLNLGATLYEVNIPDKYGNIENVVLTFEDINDYIENNPFFGSTIGRTSGRISNKQFKLDKIYRLESNYGELHIHGGKNGFNNRIFTHSTTKGEDYNSCKFSYLSKDMEQGYPGNLSVDIVYTLNNNNELIIEYFANTDKLTICNLTNHSYFNLSGNYKNNVLGQYLKIDSNKYLELDNHSLPTGKLVDVVNTPMNFKQFKKIGKDIESDYYQLKVGNGYDHPWMLENSNEQIEMYDEQSGRKMTINTTYPCAVIYTYNYANSEKLNDKIGSKHDGICFETQYEPNGINIDNFNSATLDVNDTYYEKTSFKFSVMNKKITSKDGV